MLHNIYLFDLISISRSNSGQCTSKNKNKLKAIKTIQNKCIQAQSRTTTVDINSAKKWGP